MAKKVIDGFVLERAAVVCPECQSPFSTEILVESRKANSSDIIEADLHRVFSDPQIRASLLSCCPACNYCAWTSAFKPFRIKPELLRKEAKIEPGRKYALAVKWAREKKVHSLDTAFIALNGLWCVRESDEPDNLWLELAIFEHVKGIATSPSCPADDGLTHLYLGELYRQHRDFDKAIGEYDLAAIDETSPREILEHQRSLARKGISTRTALPLKIARLYFEVEDDSDKKAALMDFEPPQEVAAEDAAAEIKAENQPAPEVEEPAIVARAKANARPLLAAISSLFSEKGSLLEAFAGESDADQAAPAPATAEETKVAQACESDSSADLRSLSEELARTAEASSPAGSIQKEAKTSEAVRTTPAAQAAKAARQEARAAQRKPQAPAKAPAAKTVPVAVPPVPVIVSSPIETSAALRIVPSTAKPNYAPSIRKLTSASGSVATSAAYTPPPQVRAVPRVAAVAAVPEATPAAATEAAATTAAEATAATAPALAVVPDLAQAPAPDEAASTSEETRTQEPALEAKSAPEPEQAPPIIRPAAPKARASVITAPPASSVSLSISVTAPRVQATTASQAAPAGQAASSAEEPAQATEETRKPKAKRVKPAREDFYFARRPVITNVPPNRQGFINDYGNQSGAVAAAPAASIREERAESIQKPAEQISVPASEAQQNAETLDARPAGAPLPGLAIDDPVRGKDYSDAINRVENYLSFSRRVYSRNWMKM
jgi:hypothetical protein